MLLVAAAKLQTRSLVWGEHYSVCRDNWGSDGAADFSPLPERWTLGCVDSNCVALVMFSTGTSSNRE